MVSQNNETAVKLVSQGNLFSHVNTLLCFNKFAYILTTWVKTLHRKSSRSTLGLLYRSAFNIQYDSHFSLLYDLGYAGQPFPRHNFTERLYEHWVTESKLTLFNFSQSVLPYFPYPSSLFNRISSIFREILLPWFTFKSILAFYIRANAKPGSVSGRIKVRSKRVE